MSRVALGFAALLLGACAPAAHTGQQALIARPGTETHVAAASVVKVESHRLPSTAAAHFADLSMLASLPACPAAGTHENVYYPRWRGRPAPVILFVHGGAWVAGSRWDVVGIEPLLSQLRQAGYAVVSIDYRLAPAAAWPAMLDDSRCALAHLRAQAPGLGLDPQRIGVLGYSAGAHLALLLGLELPPAERPTVVMDAAGPTDLTQPGFVGGNVSQIAREVFGVTGLDAPLLRQASPISYVRPGAPPVLIVHGTADTIVPLSQALKLAAALHRAGDTVDEAPMPGAGHGLLASPTPAVVAPFLAFLARYFPAS